MRGTIIAVFIVLWFGFSTTITAYAIYDNHWGTKKMWSDALVECVNGGMFLFDKRIVTCTITEVTGGPRVQKTQYP